jgi:AraC family transcriptional regulator, regulatory protein of adaptative response / methylated-DNA-[protein]-cysteine methyltransferase
MTFKTEYESSDEFLDIFSKIIGNIKNNQHHKILKATLLDTKLGAMLAIADEEGLYLLEFANSKILERKVEKIRVKTNSVIIEAINDPIKSIANELNSYFDGMLINFKTPFHLLGSIFQKLAWQKLMRVPYGSTRSYMAQAISIGQNKAYRAVANANGSNPLAIIIPCHRIVGSNGDLGGYAGGVTRKQWLINHEKNKL